MNPTLKARLFTALEILLLFSIVLAVLLPFNPASSPGVPSRDSGVFLYTGWRVLHGEIPYLQIWDHKPPVIYYLDALGLALTPDSTWGVWMVEVVSLTLAAAFGFYLLKRLYGLFPAIFISFLWLFSAFHILVGGNLTTEYALPFQFALFWLFFRAESERHYGWRGFALGAVTALLFFTRQNAVAIAVAIGFYLLIRRFSQREFRRFVSDSLPILVGGLTVTVGIVGYFAYQGALPAFWEVAFQYNFAYIGERGDPERINALLQGLNQLEKVGLAQIAFMGWGAALLLLIFKKERIAPKSRSLLWMTLIALPIELWMVSIGGRPRIPYFTVLLPVLSVFAGFGLWLVFDSILKDVPRVAGAGLVLIMVASLWSVLAADYVELSSFYAQPTGDSELIAYIQDNTSQQDMVLMWGAESAYNFMTRRASPTRFVYQYPLYNGYGGKAYLSEFLNDILVNRPRLIIFSSNAKFSDFRFPRRDNQIGALMDQVKSRYTETVELGDWLIYRYTGD
jgi:4-amino-4-deoxy-L-arabinose transferase-like glycosyltransferase